MSCPACFRGYVNPGKPRGQVTERHGFKTYVVEPEDRPVRGIIVIIPDAFGWEFGNNRLLADHYADKGDYRVYLPEFMVGHSASLSLLDHGRQFEATSSILSKIYHAAFMIWGIVPFIWHNRIGASEPRVTAFFKSLRSEGLPVGAAGFCWGGKHVALLARDSDPKTALIDAGFTAHPSMLSFPTDIDKIALPVSFALSEVDNQVSPEQAAMIKSAVEAKEGKAKGEAEIYEGTGHGFAVRADLKFKDNADVATRAEDQCINWFNKQLGL